MNVFIFIVFKSADTRFQTKHACRSKIYIDQDSCWGLVCFLIWEQRIVKKNCKYYLPTEYRNVCFRVKTYYPSIFKMSLN